MEVAKINFFLNLCVCGVYFTQQPVMSSVFFLILLFSLDRLVPAHRQPTNSPGTSIHLPRETRRTPAVTTTPEDDGDNEMVMFCFKKNDRAT
jgi:hypothetical protein